MTRPMKPNDPAYFLLSDSYTSTPRVYREGCYICEDPEFAQMGMSLCQPCPKCQSEGRGDGHIPADDEECDDCYDDEECDEECDDCCKWNDRMDEEERDRNAHNDG